MQPSDAPNRHDDPKEITHNVELISHFICLHLQGNHFMSSGENRHTIISKEKKAN